MDFALTEQQQQIRDSINRLCQRFDLDYWLDRDETGEFPEDFYQALAKDGWLGIAMPEQYGGAGLGFVSCLFDAQGSPSADDLIPGDGDEAVIFDAADREVTTWDTLDRNVRIELEN